MFKDNLFSDSQLLMNVNGSMFFSAVYENLYILVLSVFKDNLFSDSQLLMNVNGSMFFLPYMKTHTFGLICV